MKITNQQLKQIIQEELQTVLSEGEMGDKMIAAFKEYAPKMDIDLVNAMRPHVYSGQISGYENMNNAIHLAKKALEGSFDNMGQYRAIEAFLKAVQ